MNHQIVEIPDDPPDDSPQEPSIDKADQAARPSDGITDQVLPEQLQMRTNVRSPLEQ